MNKTEFARSLAEANQISYKAGAEVVDLFLGHLEAVLPQVDVLNLTGYVKFTVKELGEREARNPQTGETVVVAPTRQVRASVGATLKSAVKA